MKPVLARSQAALLALGCSGPALEEREVPRTIVQSVLNGELADADRAVVGLVQGGGVYCTGTLIGDSVVVTAAHCVDSVSPERVLIDADRLVELVERRVHPEYQPARDHEESASDIALLQLAEPILDIAPVPIVDSTDWLRPGQELRVVGYGAPPESAGEPSDKTSAAVVIEAFSETAIYDSGSSGVSLCFGDSGGPAFVELGQGEQLAGIASGGDELCQRYAKHTRVDAFVDGFLNHFPDPTAALGERCVRDDNCVSGVCLESIDNSGFSVCSLACAQHEDCPVRMRCEMDSLGARYCRPVGRVPGALGSPCDDDVACSSGKCVGPPGQSAAAVCALRCFGANAIACPEGYDCRLVETNNSYCFESQAVPEGLLAPETTGCAVSRPTPTLGGRWLAALLFALTVLVVRMRRRPA